MPTPFCCLLPTESRDGAENMACDEIMLLRAADQGIASLRFYLWSTPTLSLGYFQRAEDRKNDPLLCDAAWVRRSTGGAAIFHDRELTYCLALPAGSTWQTKDSWICRFHHTIISALAEFGVEASSILCGEEKKLGPLLCFLHQTAGDLRIGSAKIVGSAQRKLRGALLQHGSILLEQSPATPTLPGIAELTGRRVAFADLQSAMIRQFTSRSGWGVERDLWTADETRKIELLSHEKYRSTAWQDKR